LREQLVRHLRSS